MRERAFPAVILGASLVLSACGSAQDAPALLYEGDLAAKLDEQYVGQPVEAAVQTAGIENLSRLPLQGGRELLTWQRANVHLGQGATITCREEVLAQNGIIRSYSRSGDGCTS